MVKPNVFNTSTNDFELFVFSHLSLKVSIFTCGLHVL